MHKNKYLAIIVLLLIFIVSSGCKKLWQSSSDQTERPNNPVQLPMISELFASAITTNSAMILWKTPKPVNSTVNYGVTSNSMTTVTDPAHVVEHAVTLQDLSPGTTYYFTVSNIDSLDNSEISRQMNFVTEIQSGDNSGPIVSNLAASPTPTAGAALLSVSAAASDATTGGANVTAAECFIDTQGTNGTGTALNPQDGAYDSPTESIGGTVNITSLSAGAHKVYVHSRDSRNNWGAYLSADITVTTATTPDTTGPLTSNIIITPNPTSGATGVTITATIADTTTGGANVVRAEYFIDTQGTNGTGFSLTAQDGTFNSGTENVSANGNLTSVAVGTHKVYVHGQDANNNWGAFVSYDLSVTASTGTDSIGPVTSNFTITPNPTAGAASATIAATISDTTTGGSTTTGAEYFINTQGTDGSGTALSGTFSSVSVSISGAINTSALSTGTHRVYVHGRDTNNNWGGFQFVDLVVSAASSTKPDTTSTTTISFTLSSPASHSTEAIWIEDSLGNFVRTLFIGSYVNDKPSYLPTWSTVSGGKTDGTTGASRSAGSLNWKPCYSTGSSTVVSPGSYRYRIEYREEGSTSTVWTGTITLGNTATSSSGSGTTGRKISALSGTYTP